MLLCIRSASDQFFPVNFKASLPEVESQSWINYIAYRQLFKNDVGDHGKQAVLFSNVDKQVSIKSHLVSERLDNSLKSANTALSR